MLHKLTIYVLFSPQFTTPSFPGDPWLGPFPVTFIKYDISIIDGMKHSVEIYYDNTGEVCGCLRGVCDIHQI